MTDPRLDEARLAAALAETYADYRNLSRHDRDIFTAGYARGLNDRLIDRTARPSQREIDRHIAWVAEPHSFNGVGKDVFEPDRCTRCAQPADDPRHTQEPAND